MRKKQAAMVLIKSAVLKLTCKVLIMHHDE